MESLARSANRGSVSTGFDIDNSLKLEADNTEYFHYTPSSQTDYQRMAFSIWIKRTELSTTQTIAEFGNGTSNTTNLRLGFDTSDRLFIYANSIIWRESTQVFRDASAWYHFFFLFDTTQSTANDRIRVWINGAMIDHSNFGTVNNPSLNVAMGFNTTKQQSIGAQREDGPKNYLCGYIAQVYGSGGTPPVVTDFGEYDDDSGIWKPIDISEITPPDVHGFSLDFSDASDLGNDRSSRNNDMTLVNISSADQSSDSPTNSFCTFNPLMADNNAPTITEGATKATGGGGTWNRAFGTQGVKNGKWYYEFKVTNTSYSGYFGASTTPAENSETLDAQLMYNTSFIVGNPSRIDYYYWQNGSQVSNESTGWGTISANDIIGVALDLDASTKKFYIYKNGSLVNSGGTNLPTNMQDEFVFPMYVQYENRQDEANFGGYTTSTISSAVSDGNNYGNFEYAPPSGYYAICTKNIAEYG